MRADITVNSSVSPAAAARNREWRAGWPVVLSACAGMTLASLPMHTTGVFMEAIEETYGWSRAFISSGVAVNFVLASLLAPFVGAAVDRMGPRRIGIAGVLIFCMAFAALGLNNGSILMWYGSWLLVAAGTVLIKPVVWTAAVASRFQAARGMAIALALTGTPLTGMLAPGISNALLDSLGWQGAYFGIAVIWLAVILPLLLLFFYGASDIARKQNGGASKAAAGKAANGLSFREAIRSPILVKLSIAIMLATAVGAAFMVHLVPLLQEKTLSREQALILASLLGVGAVIGRLLAGYILDRWDARICGAIAFFLPAIALVGLLVLPLSMPVGLVLVLIFALGSGAELEVSSYLTARYFGMRHFGAMFGTVTMTMGMGSGFGPPIAGWMHDQFGSYDLWLTGAAPVFLICSLLILSLPRRVPAEVEKF